MNVKAFILFSLITQNIAAWPCSEKDLAVAFMVIAFPVGIGYCAVKGGICATDHISEKYRAYRIIKKQKKESKKTAASAQNSRIPFPASSDTPGNPCNIPGLGYVAMSPQKLMQ